MSRETWESRAGTGYTRQVEEPQPEFRPQPSTPTVRDIAQRAKVSVSSVSKALNNRQGISEAVRKRVLEAAKELGYDPQNLRTAEERVGMEDIARQASVSLGSVSRALKGSPGVSAKTRERVLQAARELGYDIQNLRQGSIGRVGFLIHRGVNALAHNPFYAPVLHGAEEACRTQKLAISYTTVGLEDDVAALIAQQQVDGLLCIGYFEPQLMEAFRSSGKPMVLVDHFVQGLPSVNSDNFGGARLAVAHLIGLGRKRIAFISGPLEHHSIRERGRGYRQALYDARIPADPALEVAYWLEDQNGAAQSMRGLLQLPQPPDAVFAFNDHTAMEAIQACQEAGLKVPQDIAFVGYDNVVAATYFDPPLCTVAVPKEELGHQGVELLLKHRDWPPEPPQVLLSGQLILRQSSRPLHPAKAPRSLRRSAT